MSLKSVELLLGIGELLDTWVMLLLAKALFIYLRLLEREFGNFLLFRGIPLIRAGSPWLLFLIDEIWRLLHSCRRNFIDIGFLCVDLSGVVRLSWRLIVTFLSLTAHVNQEGTDAAIVPASHVIFLYAHRRCSRRVFSIRVEMLQALMRIDATRS